MACVGEPCPAFSITEEDAVRKLKFAMGPIEIIY
jgi:hypothetical protein